MGLAAEPRETDNNLLKNRHSFNLLIIIAMIDKRDKPGTPEFEDAFNRLIATWSRAYQVTLKSTKAKQKRLEELLTWDKPREDNKWEHTAKITALQGLLSDTIQKPTK